MSSPDWQDVCLLDTVQLHGLFLRHSGNFKSMFIEKKIENNHTM